VVDASRYSSVRSFTQALTSRLSPEDCQVQSMPDASPTKWHLAHTTWFFETFLLAPLDDYQLFHPRYGFLFNSYYEAVGPRHARPLRGVLSRPSLDEVMAYRAHVDAAMETALSAGRFDEEAHGLVELGLHHEQQHQELILTDIKHAFSGNALSPAYLLPEEAPPSAAELPELAWLEGRSEIVEVGHAGEGFAFDNEGPRHRVLLAPHAIANRLVTNGEFLEFVRAGGYGQSRWWMSAGWAHLREKGWSHPAYWRECEGEWRQFTLRGEEALDLSSPVTHVSLYEADAYARWAGARLPTEFEWEALAASQVDDIEAGNFVERGAFHPQTAQLPKAGAAQLWGDVWEWTQSAYSPYPGFRAAEGAVGEYNGKFMMNQYVLRGGSVASSMTHLRPTYRNFFYSPDRWQFSGIRLARDLV
jgi:ergothioneine biosynthesis protein EgtB